jgi:acetyl-CoA carboxylase, biotin carboxylase subunit
MTGSPIRKILIANRGEIALRVIRAAKELGIETVAVYTGVDRTALHVLHADQSCPLGPAAGSYLKTDLILQAALETGADAIHPGYGFLSENADFAEACKAAGLIFIGPPAAAMRALGSKTRAREAADRSGIPRTPGSTKGLDSLEEAFAVAAAIGYPVMLKAAAGGGGLGMRSVASPEELSSAYHNAQNEPERAFGSGEVYLEKLIEKPRHIEIQLLADQHGHCLYLGERECSVQRRHQKVIEEAPSAIVDDDLRRRMGEAAVRLALSAGYTNAGTVEFLVDEERNFYFLEMNTRLQVEHPVTELVTGLDLVHLQILVAQGLPLPLTQEDVTLRGHAIECRIYAEDPDNNFFPSPGRITRLLQPKGPGIREDCGIYEGWVVPVDYDPMLSKLITYAPSRDLAIARMRCALNEYCIGGIRTNLQLFERILRDPAFVRAEIDTGYLDRLLARQRQNPEQGAAQNGHCVPGEPGPAIPEETAAIAAAAFFEALRTQAFPASGSPGQKPGANGLRPQTSSWKIRARSEGLS